MIGYQGPYTSTKTSACAPVTPCYCIGPQNGQSFCPCLMNKAAALGANLETPCMFDKIPAAGRYKPLLMPCPCPKCSPSC